ncbi:MAG: 50S ribosomal protein L29 [Desulfarculales bacterium]|jgi:large subunit ribosomal protein L29|nr:50S ribosomal protein L29 [Desulfarculales bacterium]
MKASELNKLNISELKAKADDLREEFFNLKIRHAIGQLENPNRLKQVKKDIARALTLLREKDLAVTGQEG